MALVRRCHHIASLDLLAVSPASIDHKVLVDFRSRAVLGVFPDSVFVNWNSGRWRITETVVGVLSGGGRALREL